MQMLRHALLVLPACLRAQDAHVPVSCDKGVSGGGFDELALLQQELTPASGMRAKSMQEWDAHYSDHKSKIAAEQRVVDTEAVRARLPKLSPENCADDPLWRDADGDGCEIYSFAIRSGKTTRELACNGGGEIPDSDATRSMRLRGARTEVVSDATAKIFCPLTCGMCQPAMHEKAANASAERDALNASVAFSSNTSWDAASDTAVDSEDDPSNPQTFLLQMGLGSPSVPPAEKNPTTWAEHAFDHKSKITEDERVLHEDLLARSVTPLEKGEDCVDDPLWRDADGDSCEIYKFAVESGKVARDVACGGGGIQEARALRGSGKWAKRYKVVADATARVFCPVTCGVC